ncbi:Uncharacterized protein OBRU01_20011, partial [Operophtera brumata]
MHKTRVNIKFRIKCAAQNWNRFRSAAQNRHHYNDITSESSSDDDIFAEYVLMRRPKFFRPRKDTWDSVDFCQRNQAITPLEQILLTLRFYATGTMQQCTGDFFGISKSSVWGDNAELYRNRKDVFSINTQVVADADLKIRDIVARWPGSVHDSTIFSNSRVKFLMDSQQLGSCCLLGDRGYALKKYLLTPMNREDLPSSDGSAIIENEQENIIFPVTENDQHYRRDLITTYFSSLLNSEG